MIDRPVFDKQVFGVALFDQTFATAAGLLLDWPLLTSLAPAVSTGSPTFTRATVATYQRASDGKYVAAASGEARFEAAGLLMEPESENLALHNQAHENIAWVKTNITVGQDDTDSIIVGNQADLLTASAGNGTMLQSITSVIADRSYQVAFKRKTGTGNIDLTVDNGVSWTTVAVTTSWALYDIQQAGVTDPVIGVRIVTSGDAVWIDLDQLENQPVPTSPIITGATAVTRNKDQLTIPSSGNINYSVGTVLCNITSSIAGVDLVDSQGVLGDQGSSRILQFSGIADNIISFYGVGGLEVVALNALVANTLTKLGVRYNAGTTYQITKDGSSSTPKAFTGYNSITPLTICHNPTVPVNISGIKTYGRDNGQPWLEAITV